MFTRRHIIPRVGLHWDGSNIRDQSLLWAGGRGKSNKKNTPTKESGGGVLVMPDERLYK